MSELKIEHFENDIQMRTYLITETDGAQDICYEEDGDYKAIRHLQQRIAELEADKAEYGIVTALQDALSKWTSVQFPSRTTSSILNHLKKEIEEIRAEPSDVLEYADVLMLLSDAASYNEISMSEVFKKAFEKLETNKARVWGEVNDEGFVEHVAQHANGDSNDL
jgi:hypothetical protein